MYRTQHHITEKHEPARTNQRVRGKLPGEMNPSVSVSVTNPRMYQVAIHSAIPRAEVVRDNWQMILIWDFSADRHLTRQLEYS